MLVAMPLLFFGITLLYLGVANPWRVAFVKAAVVWGLVVVASIEALSPLRAVSLPALTAIWTFASVAVALGVWRQRVVLATRLRPMLRERPRWTLAMAVLPIAALVAATGVTAFVAPPNTYDSMAYHMARVAHWTANRTVADYPTSILRQLYQGPWSEFAVLQFQVLVGDDHLANLVQWFSMIGSVAGVSVIAHQLGAPARGQVLAAIVVATLPMGILQASSTQTDYVLAFWLVCSVSLALAFVTRPTPQSACWFASSLGLAMLTKGTAYVFAAPMVVVLGYWMLTRLRSRLAWSALAIFSIPLLINSGYYMRNQTLIQNPLAPASDRAMLVNANYGPQAIVSNLLRDAVLQLGTPNTDLNDWLERGVTRAHSQLLHIGLSDPSTTYPGTTFRVNALSMDEDYAGNPIHTLLAMAAVLVTFGLAFRRAPPVLLIYSGGLVAAFLLFVVYLKWQPWSSRLELPLLVLAGPLIGVVLAKRANAAVVGIFGAALFFAAVPWVIDNQTRPLVGFALPTAINPTPRYLHVGATIFNTSRTDLYFVKRQELKHPYVEVVARADQLNCREIGFWSGAADWEYPLWVLANQSSHPSRIDSVFVNNESIQTTRFGPTPCVVVAVTPDQPASVLIDGVEFTKVWSQQGVVLYEHSRGG